MSSAPTFDELADAALLEMQRQQQEQQAAIERQLLHSNSSNVLVPGVPAKVGSATSATTGGRTVVRKANSTTATSSATAKRLSTATSPSASATAASPPSSVSPPAAAPPGGPPAYPSPSAATSAVPHDSSADPPLPAAPAEEASNLEIAQLNESNVAQLLSQKKQNADIQQHFTTSLTQQLQSIAAQQQKLAYIREELHKLDQQLSDSIDVLRNQIEDVGRQCLSLQADFTVKERDYLDSRKALAKAKQRKLLLTGHLDFIILTNEKEKAKKLKELERQMFGTGEEGEEAAAGQGRSNGKAAEEVKAPPAFDGFGGDDEGGGKK